MKLTRRQVHVAVGSVCMQLVVAPPQRHRIPHHNEVTDVTTASLFLIESEELSSFASGPCGNGTHSLAREKPHRGEGEGGDLPVPFAKAAV